MGTRTGAQASTRTPSGIAADVSPRPFTHPAMIGGLSSCYKRLSNSMSDKSCLQVQQPPGSVRRSELSCHLSNPGQYIGDERRQIQAQPEPPPTPYYASGIWSCLPKRHEVGHAAVVNGGAIHCATNDLYSDWKSRVFFQSSSAPRSGLPSCRQRT